MVTLRLKFAGIVFASLLLTGGVWLSSGEAPTAQAREVKDSRLKELLKEKLAIVREVSAQRLAAFQSGLTSFAQVNEASLAVLNAELDLCDTDVERIAVLEKMLATARDHEQSVAAIVKAGEATSGTALDAKAARLDIEIRLERIKSK